MKKAVAGHHKAATAQAQDMGKRLLNLKGSIARQ
jgi:Holliday junction resolvasome RuvABC endonuclease subunit